MSDIGIMGGTFDPIHNGHLLLGKQAYQEYGLHQVWFMPSPTPPHKKDHDVTDVNDRCQMVKLAIEPYPYFMFSDFEVMRLGNTYTAQTLQLLRESYPQHQFFFIVGADSLYEIESWYHPEEVMSQTRILVAEREYEDATRPLEAQIAYLEKTYHARISILHCDQVDISSCELRGMESRGKALYKYVPKCVEQYIDAQGLYQEGP